MLLGTIAAGTLGISLDNVGLDYTVDLPDASAGNDTLDLVSRGDIRNSSIAFQAYEDEYTTGGSEIPLRHMVSVRALDCSPASTPAYPDATVAIRSFAVQYGVDDLDDVMRDAVIDGGLRRYTTRTDIAALPEGLVVAQRSAESNIDSDNDYLRRRLTEEIGNRIGYDRPMTTQMARTIMRGRQLDMEDLRPVEARSLPGYLDPLAPRDRYGNALDWHPAHR
jgi:uncharacterized protein